ncbi:putative zinc finger protein 730 [Stegodyphus dumicola]|uniref:putative zinc finger protein 730 n=1 Tax=Stegodyphus dumicola TaxID=202533 RepID=UPI0015A800F5|nr:putative zinc finger protein 730 [Stegodyphus dumicola]
MPLHSPSSDAVKLSYAFVYCICFILFWVKCRVVHLFGTFYKTLMFWNKSRSFDKRYQCSVCPYSSNDSSNMRRHKMVHTQERPYGCMFCSKAFNHKLMYIGVTLI